MRGFYVQRYTSLWQNETKHQSLEIADFHGPLTADELAAAKAQKCRGCAWFSRQTQEYASLCHHMANATSRMIAPDYWCSEWRGEPSKETP